MKSTQNALKSYIDNLLKPKDDILQDLFDGDTIDSLNESEEIVRKYNLITIISIKNNPDIKFNTTVRQPNYSITSNSELGKGIMCYKENALDILKRTITKEQKLIRIGISIHNDNEVLSLTNYSKQKEILKAFYNKLTDREKEYIHGDESFINYVCKKSNPRYKVVAGIITLGNKIYPGSNIMEYMDTGFCLKTEDIITDAELVN